MVCATQTEEKKGTSTNARMVSEPLPGVEHSLPNQCTDLVNLPEVWSSTLLQQLLQNSSDRIWQNSLLSIQGLVYICWMPQMPFRAG